MYLRLWSDIGAHALAVHDSTIQYNTIQRNTCVLYENSNNVLTCGKNLKQF